MISAALALLLTAPAGLQTQLPAPPRQIFAIAWQRALVRPELGAWRSIEPGGPTIDGQSGTVVVGTRDGWLHAFKPNGVIAWEFEGAGSFGAQPTIDGGVVYAGTSGGVLYAVDLKSGKARWRYDAKEELGTRPVLAGGVLLVATLEDTLLAIDAQTGAWRWHHRREKREGFTVRGAAAAVVAGGTAFAAYSDGFVAALELETGKVRWERKVAPDGKYVDVDSIAYGGGKLFAAAYSGAVLAIAPDTGKTLWQVALPYSTRVALIDGILVVVTTTAIKGLSPDGGSVLWETPIGSGAPAAAPVAAGRWLAVSTGPGGLQFLDRATGKLARTFDGGQGVDGAFAESNGRGYVLGNAGTFYAFDIP
jgi:outer membrane protein assembly factor BamB